MLPKFYLWLAALWGMFLLFVLLTQGPWWLVLLAAAFVGINVWMMRLAKQR
ncbi:MAG: hypothetical protein WD294_11465 [Phycisphaeraceae bacterium]